jgi:nucleoside-diphosphate-sugar epimerase
MRIFVAGATGAIGRPLVRQLIAAGHTVTGMTRTPEKTGWLLEQGAAAAVVNALDTETMKAAVRQAEPEVVIDQLTDLPKKASPFRFRSFYKKQTPLKETAAGALLEAAVEVGAKRHIMQSVAFMYAPSATVLAAEEVQRGIYNVVDNRPLPVRKWLPAYAEAIGAKSPRRVPKWLARMTVGPIPTHLSTTLDGASNLKVRESLGWEPSRPDACEGFRR